MTCPIQKKKKYASHAAAIKAVLSYSRKRGTPLRVYYHHQCKSFHLTSKPKVDNRGVA